MAVGHVINSSLQLFRNLSCSGCIWEEEDCEDGLRGHALSLLTRVRWFVWPLMEKLDGPVTLCRGRWLVKFDAGM